MFMPKQNPGHLLERIILGSDVVILLLAWLAPLFVPGLTAKNRALLVSVGIFAIGFGLSLLIFTRLYRPWRRRRNWQHIMSEWEKNSALGGAPEFNLAPHLSEGGLMFLAIFLFSQIGYSAYEPGEDDPQALVTLVNPLGKTELVYCKQSSEPAGMDEVIFLHEAVQQVGAVKGFLWAPGGFSNEALSWAQEKPLVLADNHVIGHFFDIVPRKKAGKGFSQEKPGQYYGESLS